MIDYSYYPVLKGSVQGHITELKKQLIYRARDNIESYKPTNILDIDTQVFLISTIILRNLNNKFLIRKFVSNYGKLFESHFSTDIHKKETRKAVLEYFEITKDLEFEDKHKAVKIHIMNYLDISLLTDNPAFNMMHQSVSGGYIYQPIKQFLFMIRQAMENKLFGKIRSMKAYNDNPLINDVVNKLRDKYPESVKRVSNTINQSVPLTIQQLIDKAYNEHHLTHPERIKLGIYLQGQDYDEDYILEIYKQCSDYSEKTTKYQLKSLRKYIKK